VSKKAPPVMLAYPSCAGTYCVPFKSAKRRVTYLAWIDPTV
jgi:hypothetical protein